MIRLPLLIAIAAATSASARDVPHDADAERRLDAALAGRIAGKPQDCVEQSRVQGPERIGTRELIYRQTAGRIWRNTLPQSCAPVRGNDVLVVESFGAQLCRNDRFRLVNRDSLFGGGYCYLGAFTPYDRPKR